MTDPFLLSPPPRRPPPPSPVSTASSSVRGSLSLSRGSSSLGSASSSRLTGPAASSLAGMSANSVAAADMALIVADLRRRLSTLDARSGTSSSSTTSSYSSSSMSPSASQGPTSPLSAASASQRDSGWPDLRSPSSADAYSSGGSSRSPAVHTAPSPQFRSALIERYARPFTHRRNLEQLERARQQQHQFEPVAGPAETWTTAISPSVYEATVADVAIPPSRPAPPVPRPLQSPVAAGSAEQQSSRQTVVQPLMGLRAHAVINRSPSPGSSQRLSRTSVGTTASTATRMLTLADIEQLEADRHATVQRELRLRRSARDGQLQSSSSPSSSPGPVAADGSGSNGEGLGSAARMEADRRRILESESLDGRIERRMQMELCQRCALSMDMVERLVAHVYRRGLVPGRDAADQELPAPGGVGVRANIAALQDYKSVLASIHGATPYARKVELEAEAMQVASKFGLPPLWLRSLSGARTYRYAPTELELEFHPLQPLLLRLLRWTWNQRRGLDTSAEEPLWQPGEPWVFEDFDLSKEPVVPYHGPVAPLTPLVASGSATSGDPGLADASAAVFSVASALQKIQIRQNASDSSASPRLRAQDDASSGMAGSTREHTTLVEHVRKLQSGNRLEAGIQTETVVGKPTVRFDLQPGPAPVAAARSKDREGGRDARKTPVAGGAADAGTLASASQPGERHVLMPVRGDTSPFSTSAGAPLRSRMPGETVPLPFDPPALEDTSVWRGAAAALPSCQPKRPSYLPQSIPDFLQPSVLFVDLPPLV